MPRHIINIDWIITDKMEFFSKFGMTEPNIRSHYNHWKKTHPITTANDYLWNIYHQILNSINKQVFEDQRRYDLFSNVYFQMWAFDKEEGRNGNRNLKLHLEFKLRASQLTYPFKTKIKILSGHCCEYCNALNEKEFSYDEALENQYLASTECCTSSG